MFLSSCLILLRMNDNKLLSDTWVSSDRGVSPVIATILVVAITVILAAVIGATAFGVTDGITNTPPQANLQAEEEDVTLYQDVDQEEEPTDFSVVTITHTSGDSIDKNNVRVTVNGKKAYATLRPPDNFYTIGFGNLRNDPIPPWAGIEGESINAGDSTTILFRTDQLKEDGYVLGEQDIYFNFVDENLIEAQEPDGSNTKTYTEDDDLRLSSGDTIRMIWESGDQSVPLMEYEVS